MSVPVKMSGPEFEVARLRDLMEDLESLLDDALDEGFDLTTIPDCIEDMMHHASLLAFSQPVSQP